MTFERFYIRVIDRFLVQKPALTALLEMRITHRWDANNEEINVKEQTKLSVTKYQPIQ